MPRTLLLSLSLALATCHRAPRPAPSAPIPSVRPAPPQARPALPRVQLPDGGTAAWLTGPDGTLPHVRRDCIETDRGLRLGDHALTRDELEARPWLWGAFAVARCLPPDFWHTNPPLADAGVDPLTQGALAQRVTSVAAQYLGWGRVDDGMRWAPFLCWMPPPAVPAPSAADEGEHARKLYFLYARYAAAYRNNEPVAGQVVVKESWLPEPVAPGQALTVHGYTQSARVGGEQVQPGRFMGLFVMLRARDGEASDAGWLYATVSPQGEVTAAGQLSSCMGCHQRAPHGRLFGLVTPDAGMRWWHPTP